MDDDDVDEDEEKVVVAEKGQWYGKSRRLDESEFYPVDEEFLDKMRIKHKNEAAMTSIVKEIISYGLFILNIYFISYGNRDPMSWTLKNLMEESFITNPGFHEIVTSNDLWNWIHNTAVPGLRAQSFYNGMPAYGLRGFMGDKTNRIMGYGVLRQVRIKPNSCLVDVRVRNITQECAQVCFYEAKKNAISTRFLNLHSFPFSILFTGNPIDK